MTRYVGLEPGGKNAFGGVVLERSGSALRLVTHGTLSAAGEVIAAAFEASSGDVAAVGVDAPLFWAKQGDRRADSVVRRMVCAAGGSSRTVGHINSLRGACLVQGVIAANLAAERWPGALVTEAHPKALYRVSSEARHFLDGLGELGGDDHGRDAALAAYAAFALQQQMPGWHDLAALESDALWPASRRIAYFFPLNST